MALAANQQTQYNQLISAGASPQAAMNAALLVPVAQSAPTTQPAAQTAPNLSFGATNPSQPAAAAPVTPAPQMQAPATPTATTPQPTTQAPQTTAQPTQTTQTGQPLTFNGSIIDLLNSAGVDSSLQNRMNLAQQYGINGYTGANATQQKELADKFIAAYNANKGQPVPQSGAQATSALDQFFKDNPTAATQTDPTKAFMDAFASMNPVEAELYKQFSNLFSTTQTQQSLSELWQQTADAFDKQTGVSHPDIKLMDINKIMDGTEDDIRAEITNAGGFATESQVQAMTGARNKTLLRQANYLANLVKAKDDYVDRIVSLTQADRKQVSDDLDRKLGIGKTLFEMSQSMTKAASDNYANIVKSAGFSGLASLFKGNPQGLHNAEKAMGLPQGALTNEAFLEAARNEDQKLQFISGTENQAAGVFDPKTGKFTRISGAGSGVGGVNSMVNKNPALQTALSTILGSGTFTKQQVALITNAINNGSDPFTVIKNQAKNIMGQTEATKLTSYEAADNAIRSIDANLKLFYAAGGKSDLFTGTMEKVQNSLGQVKDPKLVNIATQIAISLQAYRNAISGTAYSNQEGQQIAAIFPGIQNTEGLNKAIMEGRLIADQNNIDGIYKTALGDKTYTLLKQAEQASQQTNSIVIPKGSMSNGVYVEKVLSSQGLNYNTVVSSTPAGKKAVIDNATGQIGLIDPSEFNPSKYTPI